MTKADLRIQFRTLRLALPAPKVERKSQQIADRLLVLLTDLFADRPFVLHTFLPITRQHEINTWLIINEVWQRFRLAAIFVPVTDTTKGEMRHVQIQPDTVFVEDRLGIPEPVIPSQNNAGQTFPSPQRGEGAGGEVRFDVVLVPLLAFDRAGQRVGYGGGYYDRFLAQCRPDCRKIGLSLFAPVDEITDVWPGDVPLDACVTPDEVYEFESIS